MNPLFRREAVESRRTQWLGRIQLVRPVSLTVMTLLAVSIAVAVVAYLMLGEYTRKARVAGMLVPDRGVIRLAAQQPATVIESHVAEGRSVRSGDVLYVLSADAGDLPADVGRTVEDRQRSLRDSARREAEREAARAAGLDREAAALEAEVAQLDAEARLQAQRLALAEQSLARLESLRDQNFVSSAQVQAKAEDVIGVRAQAQALQRQRAAQQREIERLHAQRRELPLETRSRQGEFDREIAELAQLAAENEARRRIVVRAPADGVVTGVLAQPGQPVTPAIPLAMLLPAQAQLQAHLYAPSSAVGFVRPEQPVLLRYAAFPFQKFGLQTGQVLQVSRSPVPAGELAGSGGEPLYRITVGLDRQSVSAYGQPQPLTAGMQLEADVLLERRRLIEWVFEPLLGLAGRV